jgi:predicted nucleic acid-binding protein
MIVISNSSPLIALSRVDCLFLFKMIFIEVFIPDAVDQETVIEANIEIQPVNIAKAIENGYIKIRHPKRSISFAKNLGKGERGVLNLALEINPNILLFDHKKARKQAKELGFSSYFTTDVLKEANNRNLIASYENLINRLAEHHIYLPGK